MFRKLEERSSKEGEIYVEICQSCRLIVVLIWKGANCAGSVTESEMMNPLWVGEWNFFDA